MLCITVIPDHLLTTPKKPIVPGADEPDLFDPLEQDDDSLDDDGNPDEYEEDDSE